MTNLKVCKMVLLNLLFLKVNLHCHGSSLEGLGTIMRNRGTIVGNRDTFFLHFFLYKCMGNPAKPSGPWAPA